MPILDPDANLKPSQIRNVKCNNFFKKKPMTVNSPLAKQSMPSPHFYHLKSLLHDGAEIRIETNFKMR